MPTLARQTKASIPNPANSRQFRLESTARKKWRVMALGPRGYSWGALPDPPVFSRSSKVITSAKGSQVLQLAHSILKDARLSPPLAIRRLLTKLLRVEPLNSTHVPAPPGVFVSSTLVQRGVGALFAVRGVWPPLSLAP